MSSWASSTPICRCTCTRTRRSRSSTLTRLEQRLPLGGVDVDVAGDEIGEPPGLVDAGQDLLHHLVRQAGLLPQLGRTGSRLAVQGHERRILGVEGQHLLGLAHDGLEVPLLVGIVNGDAALLAVQQELHPRQPALQLPDLGDGADGVQHIRGHAFDVLPLGDGEDEPLRRRQRGLDGAQRGWTSRADRRGHAGKQHNLAQRQDGQCQTFGHVETTPSESPYDRGK